jgi:hypothetical protein
MNDGNCLPTCSPTYGSISPLFRALDSGISQKMNLFIMPFAVHTHAGWDMCGLVPVVISSIISILLRLARPFTGSP